MKFELHDVKKGRNLKRIGWTAGYMLVQFARPQQYIFGPNIPEPELAKILANPFPDRLFTTNIKNKFRCHKVGS
jgi:hypothetical protein